MKKLLRVVVVIVLLIIVGLGVLYFYRNALIRSAVESQATASLGVKTTVGGANLGLLGGNLSLSDLGIASPSGYSADRMLTLDRLALGVNYGDLRKDPIRVREIALNKPRVVLEFQNGKFNFQALMDQMAGKAPKTDKGSDPVKLVVELITVTDAQVVVRALPLVPRDITLNIPTVTMKNVGSGEGSQNGAAIRDVAAAVFSAIAASASGSADLKNLGDLDKLLASGANQVMGQVSAELQKQVSVITGNVTGEINKAVQGVTTDLNKAIPGGGDIGKEITKPIDDGLKNLIPGGSKKDDKKKSDDKKK